MAKPYIYARDTNGTNEPRCIACGRDRNGDLHSMKGHLFTVGDEKIHFVTLRAAKWGVELRAYRLMCGIYVKYVSV